MLESIKMKSPQFFKCSKCNWCGSTFRAACPSCGVADMVEIAGDKEGEIVDFVPILFPPENLKDIGKYLSVFVRFDNGCRIFGIMSEFSESIQIGSRVAVSEYDADSKKLFFKVI